MRVAASNRRGGLRFNVTPLIDVIFILIIFFLVASHFVRTESREDVSLPLAASREHESPPRKLVITVTEDLRVLVGSRAEDRDAAEQMIIAEANKGDEPFEIRIRADKSVPFREVEPLLIACAKAGINDVKFAVVPE
ncbi:ExbD/TolR family protein [Stratiformator vulcanicus]|uniref:Biopolymer transport protein ExbD n=1 Tax=Stratiformator vulcanicus TaxID=2527980 RepID=A0A517R023_9PLAN|nr:biopolymer transporter ExbD [Stratiformator vulcanicus]QDT37174.1 Biopolymer transport protein ExbD [Stratiformator vulcanicus]